MHTSQSADICWWNPDMTTQQREMMIDLMLSVQIADVLGTSYQLTVSPQQTTNAATPQQIISYIKLYRTHGQSLLHSPVHMIYVYHASKYLLGLLGRKIKQDT